MYSEKHFSERVESELSGLKLDRKPNRLYDPIKYMIGLGGKRLRPVLMLMTNELFDGNPDEIIKAAVGIEVFHNFTLLHDDIMDKAPLRRTKETVHKKWSPDIAILSGDTMFVLSCQLMMNVKSNYQKDVLNIFFKSAIEVCEGQQSDMDFETENSVTIDEYLSMISQKTASLIGCSAQLGALCAGASEKDSTLLYEFGKNLGIAFQLHDDILDVYGDSEKFGKQVGGDILSNKKTILLLTALENADESIKSEIYSWINATDFQPDQKIKTIKYLYEKLNVREKSTAIMDKYFSQSLKELNLVNVTDQKKEKLFDLAKRLMIREH